MRLSLFSVCQLLFDISAFVSLDFHFQVTFRVLLMIDDGWRFSTIKIRQKSDFITFSYGDIGVRS